MGDWDDGEAIQQALKEASRSFPPSASKMGAVADACMKYSKEYKLVVHELERFIRKAPSAQMKVLGLYALNATLEKSREKYGKSDTDKVRPQRLVGF